MVTPENKKERFKRLATLRTKAVLQRLRILGNCANRQAYEYTEEDIKKIFSTIEEQIKIIRSKFYFPRDKEFKL
jgi:hypothetical protein